MATGPRGNHALKNFGVPRPRAPPRLIRPPSPFFMERPQPIVPDVSLIIDSATTSFHSNSGNTSNESNTRVGNNVQNQFVLPRTRNAAAIMAEGNSENSPSMNFANYYPTPPQNSGSRSNNDIQDSSSITRAELSQNSPHSRTASRNDTSASENLPLDENNILSKSDRSFSSGYESLKEDLASVMETVQSQSESINKINLQLQKIVAFQEKFLVHIVRKGSAVSKCVQTDENEFKQTLELGGTRQSSPSPPAEVSKKGQMDKSKSLQGKRSAVNSETISVHNNNGNSKRASPSMRQELLKNKVAHSSASAPPVVVVDNKKGGGGEDLSAILRSLQISNVHHPSTYSDTSMKSIEFPPFNDETFQNETSSYIGPSASAHGSDLEDDIAETILPSVTYYNNLLSTVNRILDGGQQNQEPNTATAEEHNLEVPAEVRPSSSASSKRQHVINRKNSISSGASSSRTASYSSGGSLSIESRENVFRDERERCNEFKENFPPPRGAYDTNLPVNKFVERHNGASSTDPNDNAVESTKKYLQSLGVQFDNPAHPQSSPPLSQKQNYMIQQNVYNSIYIPTVNCVPVISESVNSNSGLMDNLARKYIPSGERNQYEMMAGKTGDAGAQAETTVYGMTPGNLSFATKEYLKRHGLVGHTVQTPAPASRNHALLNHPHHEIPRTSSATALTAPADKVLDITAIRNQPKLL